MNPAPTIIDAAEQNWIERTHGSEALGAGSVAIVMRPRLVDDRHVGVNLGPVEVVRGRRVMRDCHQRENAAGAGVVMTNFAVADMLLYKDGGTTQLSIAFWFLKPAGWDSSSTPAETILSKENIQTSSFTKLLSLQWKGLVCKSLELMLLANQE